MLKLKHIITATLFCLTCSLSLFGQSPDSSKQIKELSSDHRFLMLDDDSVWFLFVENSWAKVVKDPSLADYVALNEIVYEWSKGDKVFISAEQGDGWVQLSNVSCDTVLPACRATYAAQTRLINKQGAGIVSLENGLELIWPQHLYDDADEGTDVFFALVDITFGPKNNSSASYQWFGQKTGWIFKSFNDHVKGKTLKQIQPIGETFVDHRLAPVDSSVNYQITAVDFENRPLMKLNDGSLWIHTFDPSAEEGERFYVPRWQVGDTVRITEQADGVFTLKNITFPSTMEFLQPSLKTHSKIKDIYVQTVTFGYYTYDLDLLIFDNSLAVAIPPSNSYKIGGYFDYLGLVDGGVRGMTGNVERFVSFHQVSNKTVGAYRYAYSDLEYITTIRGFFDPADPKSPRGLMREKGERALFPLRVASLRE